MDEIYAKFYLQCICNQITDGHMHPTHVMIRACAHCGSQQVTRYNKETGQRSD